MLICQNLSGTTYVSPFFCPSCFFITYLTVFLEPIKHYLLAIHRCNRAQERQMLTWFLVKHLIATGIFVIKKLLQYFFLMNNHRLRFNVHFSLFFQLGCCGAFLPCCLTYKNAEALGKSGPLYFLLGCVLPCLPILLLRTEAREKYGIEVNNWFLKYTLDEGGTSNKQLSSNNEYFIITGKHCWRCSLYSLL